MSTLRMSRSRSKINVQEHLEETSSDDDDSEFDETEVSQGASSTRDNLSVSDIEEELIRDGIVDQEFQNYSDTEDLSQFQNLDPNETRRIANEMIETCQELDEKQGFQENEDEILYEQVKQSKLLFESQFGFKRPFTPDKGNSRSRRKSVAGSSSGSFFSQRSPGIHENAEGPDITLSQAQEAAVIADANPSDMYLTFKHTKICTAVMKKKIHHMGAKETVFSVEAYLLCLRKLGTNQVTGMYSSRKTLVEVSKQTSCCLRMSPSSPTFFGGFDHAEFLTKIEADEKAKETDSQKEIGPVVKVKRGARFDKPDNAIAHEELDASQLPSQSAKTTEETSNEFRKGLSNFCKARGGQVSMMEFSLNKDSVFESLRNIFNVAFGVRDGSVTLDGKGYRPKDLLLTASIPPKNKATIDMNTRRQCIASITASCLRVKVISQEMQEFAEGDNVIEVLPMSKP